MQLRDRMESNPNYNIFVGDKRYKSNFWMKFESYSSTDKFRKTIMNRSRNIIKLVVLMKCIMMSVLNFIMSEHIISIGYQAIMILAYCILFINHNKTMERIFTVGFVPMCMSVSTHIYLLSQYNRNDFGLSSFLMPFLLLLSCGRSWYEYLIYSFALWMISILAIPWIFAIDSSENYTSLKYTWILMLILFAFTILYSFCEKVLKELWVISDSNKKSFGIFRNILECQISPLFVVDKNGKILFANKGGSKLIARRFDVGYKGK